MLKAPEWRKVISKAKELHARLQRDA